MSMTSASEPPIMATSVAVLDNTSTTLQLYKNKKAEKQRTKTKHVRSPSETSDNSSLLWQPHSPTNHKKKSPGQRRRKHHRHRHHSDHSEHDEQEGGGGGGGGGGVFLKKSRLPRELCSFEREYEEQRAKEISLHRRHSERNSYRSKHHRKNKYDAHNIELCNDYTKYEYHRKSRKDKKRRHKERYQEQTGFSKVLQRIKEFFVGKKDVKKDNRLEYSLRNSPEFTRKQHELVSGKLFRSASDSDIEAINHHKKHRLHHHKLHSGSKDDTYKHKRHWKAKHGVNKLSSIYESSDKLGGERGSDSEQARLLLHSKTSASGASYQDYSIASYDEKRRSKEARTSDGSYSHHSLPEYCKPRRARHGRRSKDYRRLKKKWAKEHQSFENDLEKLERLVELMNKKKNPNRIEQKAIQDSSFLERLEAKQEKCVAEVDFTRHVLVCKLQRLENKLEESIQDTNNNSHEERENDLEDIREEMSKECRDLRKLLQETSDQLKQVLEEKRQLTSSNNHINNEEKTLDEEVNNKETRNKNVACLSNDVPFPELSHHPLNLSHNRLDEPDNNTTVNSPTRVSTYV